MTTVHSMTHLVRATSAHRLPRRGPRHAFTLTELLVAVLVLVVVVLAAGKIFGTAGQITAVGQANADILQTASAIERQLRQDLANITTDGFVVIRSIAVPNDYNQLNNPQAPLIDPTRPGNDRIRCDQLLFFTHGVTPTQQFIGSSQLFEAGNEQRIRDQAVIESRILYGHGLQLGTRVRPRVDGFFFSTGDLLVPWSWDDPADGPDLEVVAFPRRGNELPPAAAPLPPGQAPRVNGTQPQAPRWILARQQVLLADDGRSPFYYRANVLEPPGSGPTGWGVPNSTTGIWPNSLPNTLNRYLATSRIDVAATTLADVRRIVQAETTVLARRNRMLETLLFPRAEPAAQGITVPEPAFAGYQIPASDLNRLEQMLTSPTLALGCSSFRIEWTYADGVGDAVRSNGVVVPGMRIEPGAEQPWFGLADNQRAVYPLAQANAFPWDWGTVATTIFPTNIESVTTLTGNIEIYEAVFGFNRTTALIAPPLLEQPNVDLGFTPWPTALRITLTLHDQRGSIERGREFEFILPLSVR